MRETLSGFEEGIRPRLLYVGQNVTYLQDSMKVIFKSAAECGVDLFWAANFSNYAGDLNELPCKTLQVDFSRHPLISPDNIKAIRQLRGYIRQYGINAVHCNTPLGSTCGRIAAAKEKIRPVIYTAHGLLFYEGAPRGYIVFKMIERIFSHVTDAAVALNQEDYLALQKLPFRGGLVFKIDGVGVCLAENDPSARGEIRDECAIGDDALVVLLVGRLERVKALPIAVQAFAKLENSKAVLVVCGEGPERGSLEVLARDLGIEDRVRFLGFRGDVSKIMSASDIYLMTSQHEGLPRSLVEAMNAGLACVVSNARGCIDLIQDDVNGLVCPVNDVDSFAKALNRFASCASLRVSCGAQARCSAGKYGLDHANEQMSFIYRRVLGGE